MLRQFKNSPNWYVQIYVSKGKKILKSTGTSNKRDALAIHRQLEDMYKAGRTAERVRNLLGEKKKEEIQPIPLKNALKTACQVSKEQSHLTVQMFERLVKWLDKKYPKIKTVNDLTPPIALSYMAAQYGTSAPKTYNNNRGAMSKLWRNFSVYGIKNPWLEFPPKSGGEQIKYRAFSETEILKIVHAAPSQFWKDFIIVAYYTGLRVIDICHLSWEAVNLQKEYIKLIPAKTRRFKRPVFIHLHKVVLDILTRLYYETPGLNVFQDAFDGYGKRTFEIVFPSILKKANIHNNEHGKASFHSLRVSFVSSMRKAGVSVDIIKGIVGHVDDETTEGYTDAPELGQIVKTLPNLFEV